jgi:hypothetical protein
MLGVAIIRLAVFTSGFEDCGEDAAAASDMLPSRLTPGQAEPRVFQSPLAFL